MSTTATSRVAAFALFVFGIAIAAVGIYVGDTDDAPGAAVIGIVLMLASIALGVWYLRRGSRSAPAGR